MRLFLSAAIAACVLAPAAIAEPAPTVINIKTFAFASMETTVPVGTSVTWKNNDGEPHTVVSTDGVFRSAALDEGDSYTFKFTKAGVYPYLCSIHPQMKAKIIVK